ncbi:MAG: hypothetical protein ACNA8L_00870 [Luteolibacter sp.]
MPATLPAPKDLRPDLLRRIENMPDDQLRLVHSVLLHAEKERLWAEISEKAEEERQSGAFERLPQIISQVRKEMREA